MRNFLGKENVDKYKLRNKDGSFSELFDKRIFRSSSIPLSYRQINILEKDGMIFGKRTSKKEWRNFSWRELTYLFIINKLKKYGFENKNLTDLSQLFLSNKNRVIVETTFSMFAEGKQVLLIINEDYEVYLFDAINYALMSGSLSDFICVNLNEILNDIQSRTNGKIKKYDNFYEISKKSITLNNLNSKQLTKKEEKLLEIIRKEDYDMVGVKMNKTKEINLIFGEKNIETKGIKKSDISKIENEKPYRKISKQMGENDKLINLNIRDTYKI